MLVAGVKVAIGRGFGASDIFPFFVWTIPFSIFIALMKNRLVSLVRRSSTRLKYFVMGIIGVSAGALWTYVVAFFLGPGFGAFSFQVMTCWIVGAASGLIVGLEYYDGTNRSTLIDLAIVLVLCFAALVVDRPLLRFFSDSQNLEVIAVKWTPGSETLTNRPVLGRSLPEQDLERLKAIGLTGWLEYASSGFFGKGQRGRAIIVISRQLKEPVALPQPDGGLLIYVQTENGWKMYPPNSPTLKRSIQLGIDQRDPARVTVFYVENADGTRQGGTLVTWSSE